MSKTTTRRNNMIVKVKNGEDMRRFELSSPTFQTLSSTLNHIFPSIQNIRVTYTDDEGDEILITSESGFCAALDSLNKESILHLTITDDESEHPKISHSIARKRPIKPFHFHHRHHHHRGRGVRGRGRGCGRGHRHHLLSRHNPLLMDKLSVVEEKKRVVQEIRGLKGNGKPSEEWKKCMMVARAQLRQARVALRMERRQAREEREGKMRVGTRGGCGRRKGRPNNGGGSALIHVRVHPHNHSPENHDEKNAPYPLKCRRRLHRGRHVRPHFDVKHFGGGDIC